MTVGEIISQLSPDAQRVLESGRSNRIGAEIGGPQAVLRELYTLGVTGERNGLTIKGSAVAEKLQLAAEERIFG